MREIYYKYRGVKDLNRLANILKNNTLWASKYKELNDPMEWFFICKDEQFDQKILDEYKGDVRICSLSKSFNYGLMWAMYADEHRGICLEVEIDDSENCKEKCSLSDKYWTKYTVEYKNEPAEIKKNYPSLDEVLGVKSPQWIHEQEVRFVKKTTEEKCFLKVNIKKVYLGVRTSDETKSIIYGMKACFDLKFDIIDLASLGVNNLGVNFWKDYKGNNFSIDTTTNNKIGF